jgi:hypothetical protein
MVRLQELKMPPQEFRSQNNQRVTKCIRSQGRTLNPGPFSAARSCADRKQEV